MNQKTFNAIAWGGLAASVTLATLSWGSGVSWKIGSLTAYQWFPLFGLLAWMAMCGHYYTGYLRVTQQGLKKPKYYSKVTGWVVLGALFLHPGILTLVQYQNDQGLPPSSFNSYVGDSMALAVMLGSVSLMIFLSFEIFNRLKSNKTIKKYWTLISLSQSLAMTLIFVHGLQLGSNLGEGWFKIVWVLYGFALIPCFYVFHKADFSTNENYEVRTRA